MEIKILYKQGLSIRAIARKLGLSRNTVKKYLKSVEKPTYPTRIPKTVKLADYYDYLQKRIESARPHWIPAAVLFNEIRELGYEGGLTTLRNYLRQFKSIKAEEEIIRFETAPAEQMQVDWIEFGRGKNRMIAFVATMGYSRASFVEFANDEKLETLINCHESCFEYFGGVPKEILYDNVKTVVIDRDVYGPGKHRFNARFYDFAKHYGFVPRLCRPYRAKTKGKVERFNGYLRYSFYYPLVSKLRLSGIRVDLQIANYEVKNWLRDIANRRLHSTTKQIPALLLEEERKLLQPINRVYPGNHARLSLGNNKTGNKPVYINNINDLNNLDNNQKHITFQHDLKMYDLLIGTKIIADGRAS